MLSRKERSSSNKHRETAYDGSLCNGHGSVWQGQLAIAILIAMVSYFWWPALTQGKVILHTDSAHHGLSLLTMLHQWLHHELDSLLWTPGIYGGHPLFAEGQGAFLNPLNVIVAYFFPPTDAIGIVHWLDMLASGLGVYVLCRLLNLGIWPALFAALVVIYSTIWLMAQNNLTVHSTMVWLAWTMAALQYWLNEPSVTRSALMAVPATFLVYSGYPQLAHGLAIYFVCMAIGWLWRSEGREYLSENYRKLAVGGVVALVLAICLSAVQLLPLLELVDNSHRSDGVDLVLGNESTAKPYFSGLLFFSWFGGEDAYIGIFGILSATILVVLCTLLKINYKITGYLLATLVIFNLGIGNASPLFRIIHEYGLIPGLRGFRLMLPYLLIAVIGLGILAAVSISTLSSVSRLVFIRVLGGSRFQELPVLACIFLLCLVVSYYFYLPSMSGWNYVFGLGCIAAIVTLRYTGKRDWIGPVMVLLLVGEILVLRTNIYNFYGVEVFDRPESIAAVQQDPDYQDYYSYSQNSIRVIIGLMVIPPNDPELDKFYHEVIGNLMPFPVQQWKISSIDGSLALALHRRAILSDTLLAESRRNSTVPPGQRLIDVLGVRYFSFNSRIDVPGFTNIYDNSEGKLYIYSNDYALPKLRSYFTARRATSPEEAMDMLTRVGPDTIVVESDTRPERDRLQRCSPAEMQANIERQKFSSTYYRITVDSPCSGWLYLGDAYYPGWSARVDGEPVQLYPAQVLGKAVQVPQGISVVEFEFLPRSFYFGAVVSGVAWVVLFFLLWYGRTVLFGDRFRLRHPAH
ncbi:MAG: YfhO family protein [Halioglobus sp.]|nr:YfhO family protein [Halioglobus sp.]